MIKYPFLLSILFFSTASLGQAICRWSPQTLLQQKSTTEVYIVMQVIDSAVLWTLQAPQSTIIKSFQDYYSSRTNVSQDILRRKQLFAFQKASGAKDPEVKVKSAILNGVVGKSTSARCFDLLLLERHLTLAGITTPTEFGAYILGRSSQSGKQIKIFFQSTLTPNVPTNSKIEMDVQLAIQSGWSFLAHLHSHPFFLNNTLGDIGGTTWPSGTPGLGYGDFSTYQKFIRNWKMNSAWITNGFDTFYLQADEIPRLANAISAR